MSPIYLFIHIAVPITVKRTEKPRPTTGERRTSAASVTEEDREAARKARLHALERGGEYPSIGWCYGLF